MGWLWLLLFCIIASTLAHWRIKNFWLAIGVACVGGPLLLVAFDWQVAGAPDALAGLVLLVGQVVALPVVAFVGACFRSYRSSAAA